MARKRNSKSGKAEATYWLYDSNYVTDKWNYCHSNNVIVLGWDILGDYSKYPDQTSVGKKLRKYSNSTESSLNAESLAIWNLLTNMKKGDIVYAKKGDDTIVARGIVTGEYTHLDKCGEYDRNRRAVDWEIVGGWMIELPTNRCALYSLNGYPNVIADLEARMADAISATSQKQETNATINEPTITPYEEKDFLNEVFMNAEQLHGLMRLVKRKKNVILQGPPGVGKTFSAKRLAYLMMGEKDEARVECVQFHQNYSYEDFIMGYKPGENASFQLNTGVFYDFCKKAEEDRDKMYFFIIDEINRGNLSKVFGELLQLIEADYRDKPIKLAYKKEEKFSVPSNIYIIGMMNTADRSLAMIDYALRRRFSFYEMKPGFDAPGFLNYIKIKESRRVGKLVEAVKRVNAMILSDDSLGRGFLIGHSYLMQNSPDFPRHLMESIIECDLIPLVEEYWFDNEGKMKDAKLILRKVLKDDD